MLMWAHARGMTRRLIEPGKPNQNAFIESFNGRLMCRLSVPKGASSRRVCAVAVAVPSSRNSTPSRCTVPRITSIVRTGLWRRCS